MASILILYATTDGHTRTICQRLQQSLQQDAHRITLLDVNQAAGVDLAAFDKIVIGASIRYGEHSPLVVDFINRNASLLAEKPNAFFSVNAVARKPDKCQPDTNPYLKKFLKQIPWQPQHLAVFAGKINYPVYGFFDRQIIRLIMWLTHGPTDTRKVVEFTDWQQVEKFARRISAM